MKCKRIMALALALVALRPDPVWADDPPDLSREYLSLVARHLYRWHMDESSLSHLEDLDDLEFLYRWRDAALDEGDRSRFISLRIPALRYEVLLKKADYDVPELAMSIKNGDYRIVRAGPVANAEVEDADYTRTAIPVNELIAYLFSVRNQRDYPDEALIERMRSALRERYLEPAGARIEGPQTVYIAPLSPVANHLWVFWENEGKVIRFSSDSDIATPAFWHIEKLGVELYDLDRDVVVAMAEAPGSNAYITRDWAARVLYNCIVFGKRMTITPVAKSEHDESMHSSLEDHHEAN